MLFKKRTTKIVAIAAAVLLLLVAAVTGTALVLRPTHADAVGDETAHKFTIIQPSGMTFYFKRTSSTWGGESYSRVSFDDLISSGSIGSGISGISSLAVSTNTETLELGNGEKAYDISLKEDSKTAPILIYYYTLSGSAGNDASVSVSCEQKSIFTEPAEDGFGAFIGVLLQGVDTWPENTVIRVSLTHRYTVSGPKGTNYTFTKVNADGTNPEETATGEYTVGAGPFYFTLTCKDPNTAIASVSADGQPLLPNEKGVYTLDVQEDVKISATYGYAVEVTVSGSEEGITRSVAKVATIGQNFTFIVTPTPGNSVKVTAKVGDKPVEVHPNGTNYTIDSGDITGKLTITIEVSTKSYNVTYDYDNKAVELSNPRKTATYSNPFTLTLTLNKGYQWGGISALTAGGKPITISGSAPTAGGEAVTFTIAENTINDNFTITISTPAGKYDVTAPKEVNFEFTGEEKAQYGASYSFDVKPNTGYEIQKVSATIDGGELKLTGSNGSYTISGTQITGNITIEVTVIKMTLTVTFESGEGFTYTVTKPSSMDGNRAKPQYGSAVQFKVKPASGYSIADIHVTFNGAELTATKDGSESDGYSYKIEKVTENGTVQVTGVKQLYKIFNASSTDREGYTLKIGETDITKSSESSDGSTVKSGDSYTLSVTVSDGYTLSDIKIGSASIKDNLGSDGTYTAHGVTSVQAIYVTVVENTYTVTFNDPLKPEQSVTLKYTDRNWGEEGTYQLPNEESDTYYNRTWKSGDNKYTKIKKEDIKTSSLTLELTAEWTFDEENIAGLLTLTYQFYTMGDQSRDIRVLLQTDTDGWTTFADELTRHGNTIAKLGFLYCSANKGPDWKPEDLDQNNVLKKEIGGACALTIEQIRERMDGNSIMAEDGSYYCIAAQDGSLQEKCRIHVWKFNTTSGRYSWIFGNVAKTTFEQGHRLFRPWIAFENGNSVQVILAEKFTKINEADGLQGWGTPVEAALPVALEERKSYEEPTIE